MQRITKRGSWAARVRWAAVPLLLGLLAVVAAPAAAARADQVIVLPGASSAEGIAAGGAALMATRLLLKAGWARAGRGGDRAVLGQPKPLA